MHNFCQPKLFIEDPSYRMSGGMLTDTEYSHALDIFVIVCVDAFIINRAKRIVYLAPRKAKPMQGWWVIGGRMRAGETERDAMHRKFLQETSVDIDPIRLEFLCINRYFWKDRQQEPQSNGADSLAYTFAVELTESELGQVSKNLERNEYESGGGLREFTREELVAEHIHEAVVDLYDHVFKDSNI